MGDSYSEVSNRGLGDNLIESIKGMAVGAVLFAIAFPILWWNEGRTDISTVAKKAAIVKADGSQKDGEGKLVSVTGVLNGEGALGDPAYLKPGAYVKLQRESEMYAWTEKVTKKEEKKLGGGTKETKTYTYELKWTSNPKDSDDFKVPEGHVNPPLTVRSDSWRVDKATVGAFAVTPGDIELPPARALALTSAMVQPSAPRPTGNYLFTGRGTLDSPKLGDVRVSYQALENGRTVTAYGKREGQTVVAYLHEGKDKLYRAVDGTHEQAVATLHGEHVTMTWILRALGFIFMWMGMALVLGPINAILDIVPFIGSAGRALTGIALFPIALVLSGVTIFVSMVAHNPILLVAVIVVAVAGGGFMVQRRYSAAAKKKAAGGLRAAA